MIEIETVLTEQYGWQCRAVLPVVGKVVISSGYDEFNAQYRAYKFLDSLYSDYRWDWGPWGYHGVGDTKPAMFARMLAQT